MKRLILEAVSNGIIVSEFGQNFSQNNIIGVYNDTEEMAEHLEDWADDQLKQDDDKNT